MLTTQRKQLILARLARDGQVLSSQLSEELQTSEDTIRRDLRELAREGWLQRVHGGALPASAATGNLAARSTVFTQEKVAIAREAAKLVKPGQVVIIDGGTTATQLVRQLPRELRATVVTHSPSIAVELAEHLLINVILLGGHLFRHSMVCMGGATVEAAQRIRADVYFMGVTGVHPQSGLTTGDHEESCIKRVLQERAAETVVMASSEKLGAASPFTIAALDSVTTMVVPGTVTARVKKGLEKAGVGVVVAR